MSRLTQPEPPAAHLADRSLAPINANKQVLRLKSGDLMQQMREVEIDHEGRIYRLRVTQLNKLILTA
ncbi:MAG: hemin uptake protein HemP [Undibacterium sp.]|jgi:hemin uptake protein HemP|uniref:hemin uptake protein HemP n=1 Tax=Undibacterium sp. TaxID=1914977 RepID=UPI0027189798|nr:hemin uptake protein HemP [Undibacterium sp.]MDO8654054.1 hemin uptake protein HemP [Undibacterium sp.]